jgi:predicted Zn finger-like uncharacterized protein
MRATCPHCRTRFDVATAVVLAAAEAVWAKRNAKRMHREGTAPDRRPQVDADMDDADMDDAITRRVLEGNEHL